MKWTQSANFLHESLCLDESHSRLDRQSVPYATQPFFGSVRLVTDFGCIAPASIQGRSDRRFYIGSSFRSKSSRKQQNAGIAQEI